MEKKHGKTLADSCRTDSFVYKIRPEIQKQGRITGVSGVTV